MRSLWTAISIVLLLNALALGGFALWLHADGRLSRERVSQVVEMFSMTVADEAQVKEQEQLKKQR